MLDFSSLKLKQLHLHKSQSSFFFDIHNERRRVKKKQESFPQTICLRDLATHSNKHLRKAIRILVALLVRKSFAISLKLTNQPCIASQ